MKGLHATLVTPQEAKELKLRIKGLPSSWIATTGDTLVAGERPKDMLADLHYQSLREQVRFFNGEFNSLLTQETRLLWVNQDPQKKLNFFNERLIALRPGSASGFRQLNLALTQAKTEGFAYISARPFADLSEFNWRLVFPKILSNQSKEYRKLAQAFVYLNKNWHIKKMSIEDLQQQFDLPLNCLVFIDGHLKHLSKLNELLNKQKGAAHNASFFNLTEEENFCLEQCININTSRLRRLHPHPSKSVQKQLSNIKILSLLRLYPALKDKMNWFDTFLETQAKSAQNKELLLALLELADPGTLLLETIIENPCSDAEVIKIILEKNPGLDPRFLLQLAKKCQTDNQFDLFLQQININEEVVLELIQKTQLKQNHLTKLFHYIKCSNSLVVMSEHPSANEQIFTEILSHPALSENDLLILLSRHDFSRNQLLLLLELPQGLNKKVLEALLKQNKVDEEFLARCLTLNLNKASLNEIINHPHFTATIAKSLINNPHIECVLKEITAIIFNHVQTNPDTGWENCFDELLVLLKKSQKTSILIPLLQNKRETLLGSLGVRILNLSGENLLKHLPLTRMIASANEAEFEILTNIRSSFTPLQIKTLALKVSSAEHIDKLLQRKEMSQEVGEILIEKTQYNGKIYSSFTWLGQDKLLTILGKAKDYDSLHTGLNFPILSKATKTQWLAGQLEHQNSEAARNPSNKSSLHNLQFLLEDLKIKSYQHELKGSKEPRYFTAAQTAYILYKSLEDKTKRYLKSPKEYPGFKQECEQEIQKAQEVLAQHRGYKQLFLDNLNALFAVVSLIINKDWRFFKARTKSIEIVDELKENLAQIS